MSMYNDIDVNVFTQPPKVVSLNLGTHTVDFLKRTGFKINSQQHHEITRQCFDVISNNFSNFIASANLLPNFKMLLDHQIFFFNGDSLSVHGQEVKNATLEYALGIYFSCVSSGITINGTTVPYILHNLHNDICILTYAL